MPIAETLKAIRRKASRGNGNGEASVSYKPIRLSGTNPDTEIAFDPKGNDIGPDNNPNGREGNDWLTPDNPRGRFDVNTVNGDRLQDQTGRFIHVGEAPGRIPHGWNSRIHGKTGEGISGNPNGQISAEITVTGEQGGGIGGMMYIPHTPTPRNVGIARAYLRTVDDAANVPGIFISDPTRH